MRTNKKKNDHVRHEENSMAKPHKQLTIVLGIIEHEGKLLMLRRFDPENPMWHHKWELPGGKIEPGESVLEALHREVREETSLIVDHAQLVDVYTHTWDHPDFTQQTFLIVHKVTVCGGEVILNPEENDDFEWMTFERIRETKDAHLAPNVGILEKLYAPEIVMSF